MEVSTNFYTLTWQKIIPGRWSSNFNQSSTAMKGPCISELHISLFPSHVRCLYPWPFVEFLTNSGTNKRVLQLQWVSFLCQSCWVRRYSWPPFSTALVLLSLAHLFLISQANCSSSSWSPARLVFSSRLKQIALSLVLLHWLEGLF